MTNNDIKDKSATTIGRPVTLNTIFYDTTENYIINNDPLPVPKVVEEDILDKINVEIDMLNSILPRARKFKNCTELPDSVVVQLIASTGCVCRIPMADGKPVLALFYSSGKKQGIYEIITSRHSKAAISLKQYILQYNRSLNPRRLNDILDLLLTSGLIEDKSITLDPNLMVFNNGVWHVDTKTFEPWDICAGKYVFTKKAGVNYNPRANKKIVITNPIDGSDWEVEEWIDDLFYNPDCAKTLWEILHALLRPAVNYKKGIWLANADGSGCNGKSTFLEICRSIVGVDNFFSLVIQDWDKRFCLTELPHTMACLTDETPVSERVERITNYKLVITGEPIKIEVKYGDPITIVWHGLTIMATNANPSLADRTGSLTRRLIIIPFPKNFREIGERGYIHDDYIKRTDVLEYIAYKVAHMDVKRFTEYGYMKESVKEYTSDTKVVYRFLNEFALPDPDSGKTQLKWDFCPYTFLYDLFREYYRRYFNSRYTMNYPTFVKDTIEWCKSSGQTTWETSLDENGRPKRERVRDRIAVEEPLIDEYELRNWMNVRYESSYDAGKRCFPNLKEKYTGINRKSD